MGQHHPDNSSKSMNFLLLPNHWNNCMSSLFRFTCLRLLMFPKQKNSLAFFYLHSLTRISLKIPFLLTRERPRRSSEATVHSATGQQQSEPWRSCEQKQRLGFPSWGKVLASLQFPILTNPSIESGFVLSLPGSADSHHQVP